VIWLLENIILQLFLCSLYFVLRSSEFTEEDLVKKAKKINMKYCKEKQYFELQKEKKLFYKLDISQFLF